MAELRYPRFNAICSNRNEAIKKLNELTRSYGEPVAIRYYNRENKSCVILAIFKSENKGDYEISYDSNTELLPNVYTVNVNNSDSGDSTIVLETTLLIKSPDSQVKEEINVLDLDSGIVMNDSTLTILETKKSDQEYIDIALNGRLPVTGDIVIITENQSIRSYIYARGDRGGIWQILSSDSKISVGDSISYEDNEFGEPVLEVKTDNNTIIYDNNIGGLTVKRIYGGTF